MNSLHEPTDGNSDTSSLASFAKKAFAVSSNYMMSTARLDGDTGYTVIQRSIDRVLAAPFPGR